MTFTQEQITQLEIEYNRFIDELEKLPNGSRLIGKLFPVNFEDVDQKFIHELRHEDEEGLRKTIRMACHVNGIMKSKEYFALVYPFFIKLKMII